jgi:hypothetical protein
MTTKSRFASLPKKDRDEVLRIKGLLEERASDAKQQVVECFALLQRDLATPRDSSVKWAYSSALSLLASRLHELKSDFSDRGIVQRLVDDDPAKQAIGLVTSGRLGYLMNVAGGPDYSGGYDCLHVFDMFSSIASKDRFATSRFVERFPRPFKSGHQCTVLLANAVYCVLAGDQEGFRALAEKLRTRKESRFFRAMYDCLLGIMVVDRDHVRRATEEMLKWNRRQELMNSSMQKLVCVPAHALYNLCLDNFAQFGQSPPPFPEGDTWDAEFHTFVHQTNNDSMQLCFDFSGINPVLAQWVNELPLAVTAGELSGSVK